MWFTTFVFKNVSRRLLRSLLTIFAIAIAIGSVISLVGIAEGFESSFLRLYENAGVDMLVVRSGARQKLNSTLDESLGDKMKEIKGVKKVLAGLADMVSFSEKGLYTVVIQGWQPETEVCEHLVIIKGRNLRKSDTQTVLLGANLAGNLGMDVGDDLEIIEGQKKYKVVGIYENHNVFEDGAMVVPLKELQRLMDREGKVTGFSLVLDNPRDSKGVEEIRRQIEALAPALSAKPTADHVKSISEIKLAKGMAWLTSCIALFIGFFGMMNTMVMSVHERTREIGILRALGWGLRRVIRMILLEAVLLSILGAVCGMIAAVVVVNALTHVPAASGVISGRIEPYLFGYGLLIAVVLGLLGSILPAIRASRMLPTEALRHE
jgi:putative ABC transport system permease protein